MTEDLRLSGKSQIRLMTRINLEAPPLGYSNYENAKRCCEDAREYIDKETDPAQYDLAGALFSIAEGLQLDLAQIEQRLGQIEQQIQSVAR